MKSASELLASILLLAISALHAFPAAAQQGPPPGNLCAELPEYRAFDFWIGEWDVDNPAGERVGENRIIPLLDSCSLNVYEDAAGGGPSAWTGYYVRRPSPESPLSDLRRRYLRAYNDGDLAAMADVYVEGAVRMPYDAAQQWSRAEILDGYRASFASRRFDPLLTFTVDEVLLFGEQAIERGRYREELHPKGSGPTLLEEGKYVVLARRGDDGRWRYAWSIFNRDAPPAPLTNGDR